MYDYDSSYYTDTTSIVGALVIIYVIILALCIFMIVSNWKLFKKAGKPGWAAIIPLYNTYTMYAILYGNGWKFLLLLIPFVNIIIAIKATLDLACVFGKSFAFALGLLFLNFIFIAILAFGKAEYLGTLAEVKQNK